MCNSLFRVSGRSHQRNNHNMVVYKARTQARDLSPLWQTYNVEKKTDVLQAIAVDAKWKSDMGQ